MSTPRSDCRCSTCRRANPAGSRRCLHCGGRTHVQVPEDLSGPPRRMHAAEVASPETNRDLSETQERILIEALGDQYDAGPVFVYREPGPAAGEVKAGDCRLYGDEAVIAVAELVAAGLLVVAEDDRCDLTPEAARLARSLRFRARGPVGQRFEDRLVS